MTCSSISGGSAPVLYYLSSRFIQLTLISSRLGNASIHLSNEPNVYCYDSETCDGCLCRTRLSGNKLSDRQFIYVTGRCLSFSRALVCSRPGFWCMGAKVTPLIYRRGGGSALEEWIKWRKKSREGRKHIWKKCMKQKNRKCSFKCATSLCVGNVFKKFFQSAQEDSYVYNVI